MNSVLIVLPILSLLMFDLGLELKPANFLLIARRPHALFAGLVGQILLLPALAFAIARITGLIEPFFIGLMLLACCPGGSSSNVFSALAGGNVALSVSLTAFSSLITLLTLPLLMGSMVELPVMNLVAQNIVLVLLPVIFGMLVGHYKPSFARKTHNILRRLAFPLLILLAGIFFVVHRQTIADNIATLGFATSLLVIGAMAGAFCLAWLSGLHSRDRRTIVIEVGMQNAAQAIALASSPFVFNNSEIAIPAIVYALMMNIILLLYVAVVKRWKN